MSEVTYYLKPAPYTRKRKEGDPAHKLVCFHPDQTGGTRRFLHPDGEAVVCRTSKERLWWKRHIRDGSAIEIDPKDAKGSADAAPKKRKAKGAENVPTLTEKKG